MAEKKVSVRLVADGAGKVRAELEGIGKGGAQSFDELGGAVDETNSRFGTMATSVLPKLAAAAMAAAAATAALIGRRAIQEAAQLETSLARVEAVIRATGGAAGRSATDLHEQARAIAFSTLESTQGVMEAQRVLLTFRKVQGDTFDRTIKAAADMAAALGGGLSAATLQLGKALENPITGMTALSRSGTVFTEEQRNMVRQMVETGRQAEAQNFILAELEAQYQGVASAGSAFDLAQDSMGQTIQESLIRINDMFNLTGRMVGVFNAIGIAVDLATDALYGLRVAAELPARLFNWLFNLGPTSLQAREAVDQLTLAMGDEARQAMALSGAMAPGIEMSRSMAEHKLRQMEAHVGAMEAMSAELQQVVRSSSEYRDLDRAVQNTLQHIDNLKVMQREVGEYAPNAFREETEKANEALLQTLAAQRDMLAEAGVLGPEYERVTAEIERIRAQLSEAVGETVVFTGEIITSADIAARLSAEIGGVNFSSALAGAIALSKEMGVSLQTAMRIRGLLGGSANQMAPIYDPRDPRFGSEENRLARLRATMAELQNESSTVVAAGSSGTGSGTNASSAGSGGAASAAANAADEYQRLMETLDPAVRALRTFEEAQETINAALADGAIGAEQAAYALGLATERYDEAAAAATRLDDATRKGVTTVASLIGGIVKGGDAAKQALIGLLQQMLQVQIMRNVLSVAQSGGAVGGFFSALGSALTMPSFDGGGYTGSGPRTGGLDGKGGFMAMLHPQERVNDLTGGRSAASSGVVEVFVRMGQDGNLSAFVERTAGRVVARAQPSLIQSAVTAVYDANSEVRLK